MFFGKFCNRFGRERAGRKKSVLMRFFLPVVGFFSLLWFLIRVIPKPSRAAYPCQRMAFPLASAFVLWIAGLLGSVAFIRKAQKSLQKRRCFTAFLYISVSVFCLWFCLSTSGDNPTAAAPVSNDPLGVAQGIHPGRVVWIHDPNATQWAQDGSSWSWQPENTIQKYVGAMVRRSLRELTGELTDGQAWNTLFEYFNNKHGKGLIGYSPGEKITIKVNLTTCNVNLSNVNTSTHEKIKYLDKSDTSPQVILAVLRQLTNEVGIDPNDIAVGDTLTYFPKQWWDYCRGEFPDVVYFDKTGQLGRVRPGPSQVVQHWSHGLDPNDFLTDFIPDLYADADYLINIAVLKSHGAGITLCAKNHYGSYNRTPPQDDYYNLHPSLGGNTTLTGQYRALVDIMGHPHMGSKTLLYMLDGLYGGQGWKGTPYQFLTAPFNGDWPSSIFVSQDPVAIDSVGLDILREEWPDLVQVGGEEDYLVEAALAHDPPSEMFYDPDGDGMRLDSLGVYEHWNNATDKQYSRNLGTGDGIELVYVKMKHIPGDFNSDDDVNLPDLVELSEQWLWTGAQGQILEDVLEDGLVNYGDFLVLSKQWQFEED